jgi:Uncharacterized conserved protein
MSVAFKIKELLEKEKINYQVMEHDLAFTAMEIAQKQHVPGHQMIKSVIVGTDGKWVMCVLPATHKIDFDKLKKALQVKEAGLANEAKVAGLFPGFEIGAMPPFGQMAGLKVYLDKSLEENETVAFNAGTHTDVLKIKLKDYIRLTTPSVVDFSKHI